MLNLVCGSIPLDKGTILINNQKINTLKEFERYKTIGRVYQDLQRVLAYNDNT